MNRLKKFIIEISSGKSFDEAAGKAGFESLDEVRRSLLDLSDRVKEYAKVSGTESSKKQEVADTVNSNQKPISLDIYCDGASKGNPGPASAAAVAYLKSGVMLSSRAKKLGRATNNVAEYEALILGIILAKDLGAKKVNFNLDSQLVVRQLTGEYRIKDDNLKVLAQKVKKMEKTFDECKYSHISRSRNKEADKLAGDLLAGSED
ncbi:MAG: ribonuclease HI family protein [Candidatus Krumholzibacteriota bacterium]|nr:ribonuclease HI family protein [Candidatus Krumholzibacteriota bacterium]